MTRPQIDLGVPDRVLAWYGGWPAWVKALFWICGGVVVFVVGAILWQLARPRVTGPPGDRATEEADTLREARIAEHQDDIDAAEAERAEIREERAAIAEEVATNEKTRTNLHEELDRADGPDAVDRVYDRLRRRGGPGATDG
jgi:hypothetical protein